MSPSQSQWHLEPIYHIKAPYGWLNDPCAPGYDPATGTYHLFIQWNPQSCDWGHITWGHFISPDGLHWTQNGARPIIEPSEPYDKDGIFTGCLHAAGPHGQQDQLTLIYSSVCYLPIHWTKPYRRNCAGLSAAVSGDGGSTWTKLKANPVLDGEPTGLIVTGFRDPYVAEWPAMDKLRGTKSFYGIVSGGVKDHGPTAFLYELPRENVLKWNYLGPLLDIPSGFCPSRKWSGDFGVNMECAGFMALGNETEKFQILICGSEGGLKRGYDRGDADSLQGWCMWMAGTLRLSNDAPTMGFDFGGLLDWGCFYAPASYEHPITKTRIVWGWLKEEDITLSRREAKGWAGHISLPRELYWLSITDVVGALRSPVEEITSVKAVFGADSNTWTLQTLGIRPLLSLEGLRQGLLKKWNNISYSGESGTTKLVNATNWELKASIRLSSGSNRVGFHVQHSADLSQRTTIYFDVEQEEIVFDRGRSNTEADIQKEILQGAFTLFTFRQGAEERQEKLELHIFGDGNILEIFANGRFALSAIVYSDASTCSGISSFVENCRPGSAVFDQIEVWENLEKVLV